MMKNWKGQEAILLKIIQMLCLRKLKFVSRSENPHDTINGLVKWKLEILVVGQLRKKSL